MGEETGSAVPLKDLVLAHFELLFEPQTHEVHRAMAAQPVLDMRWFTELDDSTVEREVRRALKMKLQLLPACRLVQLALWNQDALAALRSHAWDTSQPSERMAASQFIHLVLLLSHYVDMPLQDIAGYHGVDVRTADVLVPFFALGSLLMEHAHGHCAPMANEARMLLDSAAAIPAHRDTTVFHTQFGYLWTTDVLACLREEHVNRLMQAIPECVEACRDLLQQRSVASTFLQISQTYLQETGRTAQWYESMSISTTLRSEFFQLAQQACET